MSLPYPENIELNPDEPLPEWMLSKHAEETDAERLLDLLEEALVEFVHEPKLGRTGAEEVMKALESVGLKLELI
jgi:hypothetical protein